MKYLLTFSLAWLTSFGFAQITTGIIKGQIVDDHGVPLAFANIVFEQGTFVKGVSTDIGGNYKISVPTGRYKVSFSYLGFNTKEMQLAVIPMGQNLHTELERGYLIEEVIISASNVLAFDYKSNSTICNYFACGYGTQKGTYENENSPKESAPLKISTKIYPNPTRGNFSLQSTSVVSNIVVFNVLGRKMLSQKEPARHHDLDIGNLPAGQYIVSYMEGAERHTERVVLVR